MHVDHRTHRSLARAALAIALAVLLVPALAVAKRGRSEDDRTRFMGRITAVPEGRVGAWVIGGRTFQSDRSTELDERDGPLAVGACAEVDLRGGRVHEIDSEPSSHCP
jgi:hypothetical protein